MYEYLLSIKDQAGFLITLIKFFIYFCIGALLIFLIRKIVKILQFFFYKFNKEIFLEKLSFLFNLIIFVIISTIIGWVLILLITEKIFRIMSILPNISSFLIGFSYSFLLYNKIAFGISLVVGTIILMIYKKCLTLNIFNQKKRLISYLFLCCIILNI